MGLTDVEITIKVTVPTHLIDEYQRLVEFDPDGDEFDVVCDVIMEYALDDFRAQVDAADIVRAAP